jgi:hypothetical protein
MTNKEYLEIKLRYALQKYGTDAPVTLGIRRQLSEIRESLATGQNPPEILQCHAGFRKGRKSK